MEEQLHPAALPDRSQMARVWQRVTPNLNPYPDAAPPRPPAPKPPTPVEDLPGALKNPCCMGTEAATMLEVLTGFIEEELCDQQAFLALSRRAPVWARQSLREMAEDALHHAKRLTSAVYLITGRCYHPAVSGLLPGPEPWCPALRERYHEEACNAFNYARAAGGTSDPCLSSLLQTLSQEEYHHAESLLGMLERTL